jgi:hypothetical protein
MRKHTVSKQGNINDSWVMLMSEMRTSKLQIWMMENDRMSENESKMRIDNWKLKTENRKLRKFDSESVFAFPFWSNKIDNTNFSSYVLRGDVEIGAGYWIFVSIIRLFIVLDYLIRKRNISSECWCVQVGSICRNNSSHCSSNRENDSINTMI